MEAGSSDIIYLDYHPVQQLTRYIIDMTRPTSQQATNLPPPPPYTPVAQQQQQQQRQQSQYAPPPFPPPGHGAAPATAPRPTQLNLMDDHPPSNLQQYQSPVQSMPSTNPFSDASAAITTSKVSQHARRMSQEGTSSGPGRGSGSAAQRQPSIRENQLEFLRAYDTIFIVDDSSSMNVNERPDGSMGASRWEEARDALAGMVEIAAKYDDDGVEVHFLNSEKALYDCREPQKVKDIFDSIQPEGVTPTGTKLELLLLQYMDDIEQFKQSRAGKEPKKRNYVVITDGAATDDPESVIVATAMRLDRANFPLTQIGIQFVQVGDDAEAKEALQELDDALQSQHSCRDIVDTVPYAGMALNPDMLVKALLGGINRRLDRQRS